MTVGAVSQFHLNRIISTSRQADMMACVIARGVLTRDAHGKWRWSAYRETFHYRAQKVARKRLHVAHSFWLTGMGLFFGRWA